MQLENAKKILKHLHDSGIKCAIAGGYARDVFFGLEPKDIDIICFGVFDREKAANAAARAASGIPGLPGEDAEILALMVERYRNKPEADLLRDAAYSLLYDFRKATDGFHVTDTFTIYHSKAESGDCMVEGHKFDCDIDVLVYEPVDTLFQALEMFDYNLSQFALVGPELIPEYLGQTDLRVLEKTRLDMDTVRVNYIRDKHANMLPLIEQAYDEGRL